MADLWWVVTDQEAAEELACRFPRGARVRVKASRRTYTGTVEDSITSVVRVRMDHTGRPRWISPEDLTVIGEVA